MMSNTISPVAPEATVRAYTVADRKGNYARIYIDEFPGRRGGRLTINSSFGCFGYYWDAPGDSFRGFLVCMDRYYIAGKLNNLPKVFDYESTAKKWIDAIGQKILEFGPKDPRSVKLREVIKRIDGADTDNDFEFKSIVMDGELSEVFDLPETPWVMIEAPQFTHFMDALWPIFIDQLKAELGAKATTEESANG